MPSVLTLTTSLLREEGVGGLLARGAYKIFHPPYGGLIRAFMVIYKYIVHCSLF